MIRQTPVTPVLIESLTLDDDVCVYVMNLKRRILRLKSHATLGPTTTFRQMLLIRLYIDCQCTRTVAHLISERPPPTCQATVFSKFL